MYLIFALPRSRTTWLSVFLSNESGLCYHDKSIEFATLKAIHEWGLDNPNCGIIDTALIVHWEKLMEMNPNVRFILIERPLCDVEESLKKINLPIMSLGVLQKNLIEMKKNPRVMIIQFKDLDDMEMCSKLYEYCTELPFNRDRWELLRRIDMQPRITQIIQDMYKNASNLTSLYGGKL